MAASFINQRDHSDDSSFDNLMSAGIAFLQEQSGEIWTDFNLHDPGVTLLEQLCYCLTDVAYRSDLDAAQYLVNDSGRLDYTQQGLFGPTKILSSGPVTTDDYENLFLDKIHALSSIVLAPHSPYFGQFRLASGVCDDQSKAAKQSIRKLYHANRPLCGRVPVFETMRCQNITLAGVIDIDSGLLAETVLADIIVASEKYLSPAPVFNPLDEQLDKGRSMDDLLVGVFSAKGIVERNDRSSLLASALTSTLRAVAGVKNISNLRFKTESGDERTFLETDDAHAFTLALSSLIDGSDLVIRQNGLVIGIEKTHCLALVDQKRMREQSQAPAMVNHSDLFPGGEMDFWPLNDTYPIAQQLPRIYRGAGNQNASPNEPHQVARNRQLNAYLMIFEQFIVNSFSNLDHIKHLFSVDKSVTNSYHQQRIDHPFARSLYRAGSDKSFDDALATTDPFWNRRNRVLDYLLALYAEQFPDSDLMSLDSSCDEQTLQRDMVRAKIALLNHIPEIGYRRLLAQDISLPLGWGNSQTETPAQPKKLAGVQLKASLLLGFWDITQHSILKLYASLALELKPSSDFPNTEPLATGTGQTTPQHIDHYIRESFRPAIGDESLEFFNSDELKAALNTLRDNGLIGKNLGVDFLTLGVNADRYRIGRGKEKQSVVLVFRQNQQRWVTLASFGQASVARKMAALCRQFLYSLNRMSETMHLIEHTLLQNDEPNTSAQPSTPPSYQVSVFLPAWPVRFVSYDFRRLCTQLIEHSCAAHIECSVYWLDIDDMQEFEHLYESWYEQQLRLQHGDNENPNDTALNQVRHTLLDFVTRQRTDSDARETQQRGEAS